MFHIEIIKIESEVFMFIKVCPFGGVQGAVADSFKIRVARRQGG